MDWLKNELDKSDFNDARLNKRLTKMIHAATNEQESSIPKNFIGMAETRGAYRFLVDPKVTSAKILSSHQEATVERVKRCKTVLALEDTSFFNFGGSRKKCGLGPHTKGTENGLNLHTCLAVTPEGLNLGVLNLNVYVKERVQGQKVDHKKRPIEEKESYRWYQGMELCGKVAGQAPATRVVYVADREGDVYEVFNRGAELGAHWLIRSAYDRRTQEGMHLHEAAQQARPLGETSWTMKARPGRKAREVRQSIRSCIVRPRAPKRLEVAGYAPVMVSVVHACEIDPPEGEEPVQWLLLTDLPADSMESALEKVNWYRCRWQIEVFFKIVKSCFGGEKLQLQSRKGLENALSVLMIIAWRIHYLSALARTDTTAAQSCVKWLAQEEWEAIWVLHKRCGLPEKPPSTEEIIRMLGRLGGHLGRKHDGFPGAQPLRIGLRKVYQFIENADLITHIKTGKRCV